MASLPAPLARLLAWAEKKLGIDMKYTLSGGFFLTLIQVTSAIVGLGLTIAFANLLPVATYGTYRYVLAAYSLLAIAALPGIDTAVLQAISQGKEGAWKAGVRAKLKWGLLGTAASLGFAAYEYAQDSHVLGLIFIVVAIAIPFMESFSLYSAFLNGKKLFAPWAVTEILTQIFSSVVLVATMFFTKNIVLLMVGYFLPYVIARIIITIYLTRVYKPNDLLDSHMFSYGRSMTIFQIMSRIISSADQIVLYHFLGPAQVAIFSLATAVPNRVQSVFRISGTLAFPKFAQRTPKEIAQTLPKKMLLFVLGILVICGVYIVLAPFMFKYIFPKYLPSLVYSQVAIFYTLSAITYPFSSYLSAHKKVRDNYIVALGAFIPKILCLAILVPLIGVWGAIAGLLVTSFMTITLSAYVIFRDGRENTSTGSP